MLFDDIFYPDNPRRRDEVAKIRAEIVLLFDNYKFAWNDCAALLNSIFETGAAQTPYESLEIPYLERSIEQDTVKDCLDEMRDALDRLDEKLHKLVEDIGISQLIPNWNDKDFEIANIGEDIILEVGKKLSFALGGTASVIVGAYVFGQVSFAITWRGFLTGALSALTSTLGGLLGGLIAGGVGFIITDMISSAITGAIERKELEDAIDSLNELRNSVREPLINGKNAIDGIIRSVKDGHYKLADNWFIAKDPDGSYYIYTLENRKAKRYEFILAA